MAKHHRWLHDELRQWITEGLISQEQGEKIARRYPQELGISWGRLVLSSIGAILFGLGVILLFAYNWDEMHKYAKLGVVFGSLIAAHLAGYYLHRPNTTPVASEGLHALGTMLFGAGIWLVAQIYHMDEHYPNALLLWSVGALVFAWALTSLTQALMTVALVVVWQMTEIFDFNAPVHGAAWVLLIGVFPLIWQLKSLVLAGAATSALIISITLTAVTVEEDLLLPVALFMSAAAVATGRLVQLKSEWGLSHTAAGFTTPGFGILMFILYLLTFPDLADEMLTPHLFETLEYLYYFIPILLALGLWAALIIRRLKLHKTILNWSDGLVLLTSLLVFGLTLTSIPPGGWLTALPFNLLLLAISLLLIIEGARHTNRRQVVGGSLLLTLLAASRYLDLFDSLLMRSLVFFIIGGILFIVGNRYARHKEQLEGRQ